MSTAGLVLGITGLTFIFIGYSSFIDLFLWYLLGLLVSLFAVVGLPLSGAAFYRARTDGTSLMTSVAGLATNAVVLALSSFGGSALLGWLLRLL